MGPAETITWAQIEATLQRMQYVQAVNVPPRNPLKEADDADLIFELLARGYAVYRPLENAVEQA